MEISYTFSRSMVLSGLLRTVGSAPTTHLPPRRRKLSVDQAAKFWRDLLQGGWTLLDCSDGGASVTLLVQAQRKPPDERLSPGEAAVVSLALAGCANKHIAYELGVAQSTISTRLSRAMSKLSVRSRAELQSRFGLLAAAA